jgi:outer membrane biosynthesis protein TonB
MNASQLVLLVAVSGFGFVGAQVVEPWALAAPPNPVPVPPGPAPSPAPSPTPSPTPFPMPAPTPSPSPRPAPTPAPSPHAQEVRLSMFPAGTVGAPSTAMDAG